MSSVSLREDHGSASALNQWPARTLRTEATDSITFGTAQHPATSAFEEDLRKSWVYQRSLVRGPRTFSLATSKRLTQVTQSWSVDTFRTQPVKYFEHRCPVLASICRRFEDQPSVLIRGRWRISQNKMANLPWRTRRHESQLFLCNTP